ncbi:MAG: MFS transporter [Fibrobacterota bacterium]
MTESVKRESFLLKQTYLVLFFAMGLIAPFTSVFFKYVLVDSDGNTADGKIKIIMTAVPLIAFLGNIIAGVLADKLQLGRRIVTLLCGLSIIPAVLVGLIGEDFFMSMELQNRFYILTAAFLLFNLFSRPINPLLDSETLGFLNTHSHRRYFGKYRFWGTVGWGVIAVFIGFFLTYVPEKNGMPAYSYNFYFAAFFFAVLVILSFFTKTEAKPKPIKIPWRHLGTDRSFFMFLIFVFFMGIINNAISMQYMGYYLDDVTETPLQMGLMFGFWTIFEFPVMLNADKLIQKFGNRPLMIAGLILTALKLYLFSLFTVETPFVYKFLAILIHGPAFSLYFLALIDFVDHRAHEKMRATYMALTTVVRSTLAGAAGGWICGAIIQEYGSRQLMVVGAWGTVIMTLYFLVFVRDRNIEKKV